MIHFSCTGGKKTMKLEDIARLANVSKSAASLALNGKPGVSDETRALIKHIAKENNYVPLRNHRKEENDLRLKIRFVACTNNDVIKDNYRQLPFFNELISCLSTEVGSRNHLFLTNNLAKEHLVDSLYALESNDPSDGILLLATNLTSAQISDLAEVQHLVILDTESSRSNCTTLTMNNFLGSYDAAEHLLKMGHKKIGYIKGTPRINNFYDRRRGFKEALKKHGIDSAELPKYYLPGMDIQEVKENLDKFLDFINSVTAVFCENDYIAINVMKTLNKHGIRVPEDVSIIGFDDIPESRVTMPELTTVHVPIEAIAKESVELIERSISSENYVKRQIFFNTHLVKRESVKQLFTLTTSHDKKRH